MFCPKCSQEQASDDIRFCSRCGFQLNIVKALLVNDRMPAEDASRKVSRSFSKRDMSIGALLMFLAALVVAALTVGLPPFHSGPILFLMVSWLALTLLINIKPMYQYFTKPDDASALGDGSADMPTFAGMANLASLPESQSVPVDMYFAPVANTADIKTPASVTEETTNLLDKRR
jgi:hypothetical protein